MDQQELQTSTNLSGGRMMTMPEQYIPKVKKGFSLKTIIIALSSFIVLALIVVAILVFTQPSDTPTTIVQEPQSTEPTNQQPSVPTDSQDEQTEVVEEPQVTSTQKIVIPEIPATPVALALDTDQDGLSDSEEVLFATSVSIPDTDSDGFLDGSEVLNLYDPATPVAFLEVSPRVKVARNEVKGFQFLVPSTWVVTKQTPLADEMIVTHADGFESFHFEVIENPERLSAIEWYRQEVPSAEVTAFVNFENEAGWKGIQSRDTRLVIATYGESGAGARAFIFLLHYDLGQETKIQYKTVWQMMLQSMSLLDLKDSSPSNQ